MDATIDEVADILADPADLPRWWPEVYLDVRVTEPGDADGVGLCFAVLSRGWLPYRLRWQGEVTRSKRPFGWTIAATGDLSGEGTWELHQKGRVADICFTWTVLIEKASLRPFVPLLRPVFAANHNWAMARGLEGLRAELARRRMQARV